LSLLGNTVAHLKPTDVSEKYVALTFVAKNNLRQKPLEATCSSETSAELQRTTWRYIPEERTFQYSSMCDTILKKC
jgi:hypothetical protein